MKSFKKYFKEIPLTQFCGFAADEKTGKEQKVLYHVKIDTVRLNALSGKHRIVQSYDPVKKTTKYLIINQLTWETNKILSAYNFRWAIEEFFRNAKQLTDMEGATVRREQGVTLSLYLVSWIDFLLHYENFKQSTAGKLTKDSLTIPSIVRRLQFENLRAILDRVENDKAFVPKWLEVVREKIDRRRKRTTELVMLDNDEECLPETDKAD